MPSSHLILCRPLLLLPPVPPSIRVFSNKSTLHMRWPKYWSFSFSIIPSKEIPGLISFRMDWLDLLAVQGTLQHHSSKASILRCSAFFIVQLSHPYMTTGKTIALTRWTLVSKVMSEYTFRIYMYVNKYIYSIFLGPSPYILHSDIIPQVECPPKRRTFLIFLDHLPLSPCGLYLPMFSVNCPGSACLVPCSIPLQFLASEQPLGHCTINVGLICHLPRPSLPRGFLTLAFSVTCHML